MSEFDSFGYWFAGFTDGEGCFLINHQRKNYSCQFSIQLRADDDTLLKDIQSTLCVGRILYARMSNKSNPHPRCCFTVSAKAECLYIKEVFTRFPLRGKKAQDFEIWKTALDYWVTVSPKRLGNGQLEKWEDWSPMAEAKKLLESNRKFKDFV